MTTPLLLFVFVALALQTVLAADQFSNGSIELNLVININGSIPITYEVQTIESSNMRCQKNTYTCGGTDGWTRIAYLNMSDSSQHCPGELREVTYKGIRLCGRPNATSYISCASARFPTNNSYSAVCGRVLGYQYGGLDAFRWHFVEGVTLTHGPVGAREHIWTFAVGVQEHLTSNTTGGNALAMCPCASNADPSIAVPSFIGENYFCESGTYLNRGGSVFHNDPLWDGDGCPEGNSCCTFNNPPYFTRQLPASTSDDIELQNCAGFWPSLTDTLIQFIELYVK